MRLESFEYLVALSRHASMSAASRELHVTPQALSVAIGRLERELGVKLVRTDNQGTRLNENGRYLVAKTQMFFDAIAEVRAQSQAAEGPCAVRVLADKAIKEDFAAELVRRLDEAAQPLALALDYCDLAEVETRFLAGNYDLAICYRDQVGGVPVRKMAAGLYFTSIWRSPIYVVMSAQHPLAKKGSASLAEIAESGVPLVVDGICRCVADVCAADDDRARGQSHRGAEAGEKQSRRGAGLYFLRRHGRAWKTGRLCGISTVGRYCWRSRLSAARRCAAISRHAGVP